ncbi:tetratricopeptide repeat protein [Fulvivirga sp. 29W222]|uniref:Tetratricopeptide repeat protein n=1 Tax=Fulvivirga marina TaxID=2494733 RepID=A0A937FT71_9BACT|nr:tetratricopeptide repeat protein [Fulvivirga marina]MBL6445029.1 tetratricopeptide repeat protein [Fulvivirga marina]
MTKWLLVILLPFSAYSKTDNALYYYQQAQQLLKSDQTKALDLLEKSIAIAEVNENIEEFAKACYLAGCIYLVKDNQYNALKMFYDALKSKNDTIRSNAFNNIGVTFFKSYSYRKAVEFYLKALSLKQQLGEVKTIPAICRNLGMSFRYLEKYDSALYFHKKALAYYDRNINTEHYSLTLNDIGLVYKAECQYEYAIDTFQESIAMLVKGAPYYDERFLQATTNIGETYALIGMNDLAHEHFLKTLVYIDNFDHWTEFRLLNNLGSINKVKKQYDSAIYYYEQVVHLAAPGKTNMEDQEYVMAHEQLSFIYEYLGESSEAIALLRVLTTHHKQVLDKVANLDQLHKQYMAQLALYEIQVKQKQEKLESAKRLRVIISVAATISLMALAIFIIWLRKKLRNRIEEHQRRENIFVHWLESW